MISPSKIPLAWSKKKLQEVLRFQKGKKPLFLTEEEDASLLPYIDIDAFENLHFKQFTDGIKATLCFPEDVVIVWDGARCGLVGAGVHGALGSTLGRLTSESISSRYLLYFLNMNYELINKNPRGTGLPHVNPEIFWNIEISFPSFSEQENIVAKLEAILTQINPSRAALGRIPALLKAFRQSVLAAAFRGELTERDASDEPALMLLERIRAERRNKWEENLRTKGKHPANFTYEEPAAPDTSNLPELPQGWVWTILQNLAGVHSGVTKGRDLSRFETIDVPYLRVANVQAGFLDLGEVKSISIKPDELDHYRLLKNDVLYTEGGDRDKLGRGTVWKSEIDPCIHQNHIFCARLYLLDLSPEWVSMTGQLEYARDYVNSVASQSVNLASINSTNLKAMPIPLPPIQEQLRIVQKIKVLYGQMNDVEIAVKTASHRLDMLEQAALSRAFRGEL